MIRAETEPPEIRLIRTDEITTTAFLSFRVNPEQIQEFAGLVSSIRKYGLLQPVLVRHIVPNHEGDTPGTTRRYELIAGHRRLLAFGRLHLDRIPCIVMDLSDQECFEVALVENVQHQTLNPIEEAEAFKSYVTSFGRGSVTRLARKIGKSEEYVSHRLLLLGLPKVLEDRISRRLLNVSSATELVWLKNERQQVDLSEEISRYHLSLREIRAIVRMVNGNGLDLNDGIHEVIAKRKEKSDTSQFNDDGEAERRGGHQDPWEAYRSGEDGLGEIRTVEHAILIVRTCLAGLDLLTNRTDSPLLSEILRKERRNVHSILDELVQVNVSYRRHHVLEILPHDGIKIAPGTSFPLGVDS